MKITRRSFLLSSVAVVAGAVLPFETDYKIKIDCVKPMEVWWDRDAADPEDTYVYWAGPTGLTQIGPPQNVVWRVASKWQ